MTTTATRMGPPPKGQRSQLTVRVPVEHADHFTREAQRLGIPRADYIAYRAALCEGLDIPSDVLWFAPRLVLLYLDPDSDDPGARVREVVAELPREVIERFRAQVPEVAEMLPPPPPLDRRAVRNRALELRNQGLAIRRIAAQLNAEGWRTRRGSQWYYEAVNKLLHEPTDTAAEPLPLTG